MLKDIAWYGTGGKASKIFAPTSIQELAKIIAELHQKKIRWFPLGAGTNSLVSDEFWNGAVIHFNKMKKISRQNNHLTVEAGVDNSDLSSLAYREQLAGISWMFRLPGQLGATVRMNAKCYGGEIDQVVISVTAISPSGQIQVFKRSEKIFRGYKDTIFMDNGYTIAEATLQLRAGNPKSIKEHMDFCEADRISKNQFKYPSCGCVFKNDRTVGVPSGMLLENSDIKHLNTPAIEINPKHCNFVFNKGTSSRNILETTLAMRQAVWDKFGVWMEYEMEVLGNIPKDILIQLQEHREHNLKNHALEPLKIKFQQSLNK